MSDIAARLAKLKGREKTSIEPGYKFNWRLNHQPLWDLCNEPFIRALQPWQGVVSEYHPYAEFDAGVPEFNREKK